MTVPQRRGYFRNFRNGSSGCAPATPSSAGGIFAFFAAGRAGARDGSPAERRCRSRRSRLPMTPTGSGARQASTPHLSSLPSMGGPPAGAFLPGRLFSEELQHNASRIMVNVSTRKSIDIESAGGTVKQELGGRQVVELAISGAGAASYALDVRGKDGEQWIKDVGPTYSGATDYDDVLQTGAGWLRVRCTSGTGTSGHEADILLSAGGR